MATGFGFCPNCGTALAAAGQIFCISCGAALRTAAPAPAPAPVPTPAAGPAAVAAPAPAPVPVAMPAASFEPYAPAQPAWAMPPSPVAPAPARRGVSPAMLLVGGLVIAAIVGVALLATNNGSKIVPGTSGSPVVSPPPVPSAGYPGSLAFSPKTIGCPSQPFTTTVVLPSSVIATDQITYQIDDTIIITQAVTDFGLTKQADGKWSVSTDSPDGSSNCSMGPGLHTARLLDATGKVLAQTSFTFVLLASPTPPPSLPQVANTVTITPPSFSCSAAEVQVTLALQLSASVPGSSIVTPEVDGTPGTQTTVEAGFVQQSDGSWLSSDAVSSTALCEQLSVGKHTIGAFDATGKIFVEGTFAITP
jgi:hypothetical protein